MVVFEPAANVAVGGTVATRILLELRLTVSPPAGAAAERVSVMLCTARGSVILGAGQETVAPTLTCFVDEV